MAQANSPEYQMSHLTTFANQASCYGPFVPPGLVAVILEGPYPEPGATKQPQARQPHTDLLSSLRSIFARR